MVDVFYLIPLVARVQYPMLDEEDDVVADTEYGQSELYNVESPIANNGLAFADSLNDQLQEGEDAACEVEQDIADGPADG